jgi:hypothetical protein
LSSSSMASAATGLCCYTVLRQIKEQTREGQTRKQTRERQTREAASVTRV